MEVSSKAIIKESLKYTDWEGRNETMILRCHVENPKELIKKTNKQTKLLELMSDDSKISGYKNNTQN